VLERGLVRATCLRARNMPEGVPVPWVSGPGFRVQREKFRI